MNNSDKNLIRILIVGLLLGFLFGAILSEVLTAKRMEKQSLLGYKGVASYSTNEFGEIKILKIDWKKNEN